LKSRRSLDGGKPLDLDTAKPKILERFARDLGERDDLRTKIDRYSAIRHLTVKHQLYLALLRNTLRHLEPPLPPEIPLTPESLWRYWTDHSDELEKLQSEGVEIVNYLASPEQVNAEKDTTHLKMLEWISVDRLTYLACYPVVEDLFKKKRGRPSTRGPIAARALQLKWDTDRDWAQIANEVCDCGQASHTQCCRDNIRQAVMALQGLLKRHGFGLR